jgi:hypothetical protein
VVLTTIATFYLAVGIAITLGGNALMAGVALFALSFRFDPKLRKAKEKSAVWTERVHRATGSPARSGWILAVVGFLLARTPRTARAGSTR